MFRYNNSLHFKLTTFSHPSTSFARSSASGVLSPSEQNLKKDTHGKLFSMLKQNSAVLKTYQNYNLVGDICFSRLKILNYDILIGQLPLQSQNLNHNPMFVLSKKTMHL